MSLPVEYCLAAGLTISAVAKLVAPKTSIASLTNLGFSSVRSRRFAWALAVVAEISAAVLLIAVPVAGLFATGALFALFAGVVGRALATGSSGKPCGCLGARGTVSPKLLIIDLTLSALALGFAINAVGGVSPDLLIGLGFIAVTVVVMGLSAAVVALAREVGVLKLAMSSGGALEMASEGPEVGSRHDVPGSTRHEDLTLAVFTSEGCPMCRTLGPSLEFLRRDTRLTVVEFDEHDDHDRWESLDVPGSPYAIAFSNDGVVLAKGTFNGLSQLESVVATAVRRRQEASLAS